MSTSLRPFLMFEGRAEEALRFYAQTVPGSEIGPITRYGAEGPGPEGSVLRAEARLAGQPVLCTDSFVRHDFGFTPAFSLFIEDEDEGEVRRLFAALSEGGKVLMPLGAYPFSRLFGWTGDRYGVSWQVNLR